MKKIVFPTFPADGPFQVLPIVTSICEYAGQAGLKAGEMRKRFKLLDRIEAQLPEAVLLEDAEYEHLRAILNAFDFGIGKRELNKLISAIEDAKDMDVSERPA